MAAAAPSDASIELARFAAETRYAELSPAVLSMVKAVIMDTLGVASAGAARGTGQDKLARLLLSTGGAAQATVIGHGTKAPAWMAAMANGASARGINFDDGHDEGSTHPSGVVVPAVFAMAEQSGKVDGRTLMAAVAVGNEIIARLGRALARRPESLPMDRWFLTSVLGVFGATAACCRVLGLDAAQTRDAFGIVLFESAGTLEAFSPTGQASMIRGMIAGFSARSAVMAASMAEAGITGVPDSFDGRFGLFRAYFDGSYDRGALLDGLGRDWALTDIGLKAWPTVRYASSYVDAIRRIVTDRDIKPGAIAEIRAHVAGYAATRFEPTDRQRKPTNYNNAGHATPYLIAAMATRRQLTIQDLSDRLEDAKVLALAQRVVQVHDPEFGGDNRLGPAKVAVTLKDGSVHEQALQFCYGDPQDPMSWDDIAAKFRSCVALRTRPLPSEDVEALVTLFASLGELPDATEVIRRLA
jgi:2-methylcitrate dehydratase PrpD